MKETEIIKKVNEMCIESLSPDMFEKWEDVKERLEVTRKDLKNNLSETVGENKKDSKSIYNSENILIYAGVKNVRFVREESINNRDHVVMIDKDGDEKTVYKTLFDKYTKVQ